MKRKILYKNIVTLVFFVAFFAHTFGNGFYIADYYTNPAKYAKNCINKAKPKLNCNGKCQLMKKIQEQEKNQQKQSESANPPSFEILLNNKTNFASIEQLPPVLQNPFVNIFKSFLYNSGHLGTVFRPPC